MTGRAKTQVHIVIDRKPEDVFAYLADVQKHNDWSPKAYRVEGLDGPVKLGTTFTSYGWVPKDADHRNDVEVTAFEPSTRIEFTGREKGEDFVNTYVLIPEGNATRIDRTLDFPKPSGFGGSDVPAGPRWVHQARDEQGHEDAEGEPGGRGVTSGEWLQIHGSRARSNASPTHSGLSSRTWICRRTSGWTRLGS